MLPILYLLLCLYTAYNQEPAYYSRCVQTFWKDLSPFTHRHFVNWAELKQSRCLHLCNYLSLDESCFAVQKHIIYQHYAGSLIDFHVNQEYFEKYFEEHGHYPLVNNHIDFLLYPEQGA